MMDGWIDEVNLGIFGVLTLHIPVIHGISSMDA